MTQPVWSANGDYAYCVKMAVGLVTKLSKGNFSCKPQTNDQAGVGGSWAKAAEDGLHRGPSLFLLPELAKASEIDVAVISGKSDL